jgi:NAD(P)-dependent dehydrogenase (short-subunit alcohol dehydrogenase family)
LLAGKTVLIIGGGAGIGLAVARQALDNGARVVAASRNAAKRLADMPEFQTRPLEAHAFDLTRQEDHAALLDRVGEIDHLVFAVRPDGVPVAPFAEMDLDAAEQAFGVKFWGVCRFIQAARDHIRDQGGIILTSGIAGEKIYPGHTAMEVIDSAVETLGRALAVELAPLRVNVVSPGFVEPKTDAVRDMAARFPAGRLVAREEVAAAYLSLMNNPYVTGSVLKVDGGASLI